MRRYLIFLLLAVFCLGLPVASISQAEEPPESIKMTIRGIFGGRFKYGEWLPILVTVENPGPEVRGEIRATINNQTGQTNFITPAELPTGARKRFILYTLPNNFSRTLQVELVQEERSLLTAEMRLSLLPNDRYVIGLIATESTGLIAMNPPQLPGRRERADTVTLALEDIPDRAEGLNLLNALILNNVDTSQLTPDQRHALAGWVTAGGRLVIGGGAGAGRTLAGLPAELQPATLEKQREAAGLPGLETYAGEPVRVSGPFLLAQAQPANEAAVLLSQDMAGETIPLVIEQALGAGHVNFIALDLSGAPFDAWAGVTPFAGWLLSPGAAWPDHLPPDVSPGQMSDSQMSYALMNLPALDLPSIRLLGLLLIGYIILVGPANYLVLRRFDRMAWAWVSIPVLTLIFSGLAYAISFSQRGSDIIVNQVSTIELGLDGQPGRSRTYVGIFSPRRQAYNVEVNGAPLIRPLGESYNPWSGTVNTGGMLSVVQGNPVQVRGLAINQWSMQSFVAEMPPEEIAGLAGQLLAERNNLHGHIINQGNLTWQDVIVVFNGQFQKLGDLEPGQRSEVRLEFDDLETFTGGFGSYMLFQDEYSRPGGPSREISFKQNVLDGVLFNNSRYHFNQPIFLAWSHDSLLRVSIEGQEATSQKSSLLYGPLPLTFEGKRVAIPPGFSRVETVSNTGDAGVCNYGQGMVGYQLLQGAVETLLVLPENVHNVTIDRLDLFIRTDGGWSSLPAIELYDRQDEQWVLLPEAKIGLNPIQDVSRFYESGSVRLRLSRANAGQSGGCIFLDLAMEGQRL